MLTTTAALVGEAVSAGSGVAAFNVITLEQAEAVAMAAESTGLPAVVQISQNAARYHGDAAPLAAAVAEIAKASRADLSLHLDHVDDPALLRRTAECGASSVMFDASRLTYEQNVEATRSAAEWAHGHGLFIEAELGEIGGKGGAHAPGVRTDPDQAAAFVAATGVDALAVAVGSRHAMLDRTADLDLDLIARLRTAVDVPLVLHGSSGVSVPLLRGAVARGMTKINIGTLLNVAFTGRVRPILAGDPALVDPRRYLNQARASVAGLVAECLRVISRPAETRENAVPQ